MAAVVFWHVNSRRKNTFLIVNIGTAGLPKTYDHAPGYCGLTFWLTVIQLLLDLYFRKNA